LATASTIFLLLGISFSLVVSSPIMVPRISVSPGSGFSLVRLRLRVFRKLSKVFLTMLSKMFLTMLLQISPKIFSSMSSKMFSKSGLPGGVVEVRM